MAESPRPRFSMVSAAYNVARYLPEFIDSIDRQIEENPGLIEVVVVDDGSSDETLEALRAWEGRRPGTVRVLTQPNAGQGAARNAGLEAAVGEWVTFPDPDDILEPGYIRSVVEFLDGRDDIDMVATNRLLLNDSTKELTDKHPLRRHFVAGDRARALTTFPDHFHGSAPAAFYRLDRIRKHDLRFDHRIRPNFEDGHFSSRYLLLAPEPTVAFLATARYQYRKRSDQSSTLQGSYRHPGRFTAVLRHGYLDVLETAERELGHVPEWLQNFVLYELSYYFAAEDSGSKVVAPAAVADEFHELMRRIVRYLDPEIVEAFSVVPLRGAARDVLLHAYRDEPWVSPYALVEHLDSRQGLVRVVYRFTGDAPEDMVLSGGEVTAPAYTKVRALYFHGRPLLRERIHWVPASHALRLVVDGRVRELRFTQPPVPARTLSPARLRQALRPRRKAAGASSAGWRDRLLLRVARSRPVSRRLRRSWVLMDRIHNADDSAEHLFRYLRENRKDIDAKFVVQRGTPDWRRLRRAHGRRVVAHGSLLWKLLMLNCQHLVSSHADIAVCRPPAITSLAPPSYRFTFLQHGVIKDDLSSWLNHRPLDVFVTSTQQEHDSIVGDDTPYIYTERETKLTGLPRFDLLYEQGQRFGPDQRDVMLICPTWRVWLVPPLKRGSQRRELVEGIEETQYVHEWLEVLRSTELADAAARHGLKVAFLPHPNMDVLAGKLDLPSHVEVVSFEGRDVRELFARSAVLLTDYSSVAFNAAYLDRPVVYFQFDRERMTQGGHVGRAGYFDYGRDGFGPVTETAADAVAAAVDIVDRGPEPDRVYLDRIAATFPVRDGRCRERVVDSIEGSTRRYRAPAADE
ncbi:bifunctional glycosyltransferase family 2 protein/CDP-glycerol:glycerophosphate glycerophosphotransferase [Mumia sp. zg.B53]|uniref:bifunctional glycosyltransferase/CDP-glycerol:glycerophosphate glycerophosphotransferase n=1 Tax=Mumia sp. zg.B53 TaxID=2855449 RepID=UPI001C6E6F08|nr:CDP-glycerol glycerophosphotransferase family protein [Mumia sp. zg.B53]MBW9214104.1 bifunctional glycosyltransferase family 2 protein/CDP-glycerol:glycerophosphate glycerophosphotransferase [Mumia sp. zg.B53]